MKENLSFLFISNICIINRISKLTNNIKMLNIIFKYKNKEMCYIPISYRSSVTCRGKPIHFRENVYIYIYI